MSADLGTAHLTLLDVAPPDLVSLAAGAGLDFVGLRVRPVTDAEPQYDLRPGSALCTDTLRRLADTGLRVRDIEFLALTPETRSDQWLPMLEAGAALGAETLSVTAADDDHDRLGDTLARLTSDAAPYGIRPTLEAISYQSVARLADAVALAQRSGAAVLVDTLHLARAGEGPTDVARTVALDPGLVPLVQICDGPLAGPPDVAGRRREARQARGVPGAGEFPLAEVLAARPAGVPVSLEVPNTARRAQVGAAGFLEELVTATRRLETQHV